MALTKIDAALLLVPFDVAAAIAAFGADQAFCWMGAAQDREAFFTEMGRRIAQMTEKAWAEETERTGRDR